MFPNFSSLAQREQKRLDLLERVKRRVRQEQQKRQMYADAQWASDVINTISVSKQSTQDSSIQTDDGLLKKPPIVVDTMLGSQDETQHAERSTQTALEKIVEEPMANESPSTNSQEFPEEKTEETIDPLLAAENESHELLIGLYQRNPPLSRFKFLPRDMNARPLNKYYIGKDGDIFRFSSNRKVKSIPSKLSWIVSESYVRDMIRNNEDVRTAILIYHKDQEEETRKKAAIKQSTKSADTGEDQNLSRERLYWFLSFYEDLLRKHHIPIEPIFKHGDNKSDNYYLKKDDRVGEFKVINYRSKREAISLKNDVDYVATLSSILQKVKAEHLDVGTTEMDKIIHANHRKIFRESELLDTELLRQTKPGDKQVGSDRPYGRLSIPDQEARSILEDYVKQAYYDHSVIDLRVMLYIRGQTAYTHFLDWYKAKGDNHQFGIRTINQHDANNERRSTHPLASGKYKKDLMSKIDWTSSLDILYDAMFMLHEQGDLLDEVKPQLRPQNLIEEKRINNTIKLFYSIMNAHGVKDFKFPTVKHSDDEIDEFRSKREAMSKPNSRTMKIKKIKKISGRGLMGAGMTPLEGATRRKGQTYNLNDIQNLATPSAYIYRKLGSKFIRLPDLDKKTLTICQPNRRKCGPMREISDSLQSMIKDLVFNNELSQDKYDKLSIDDKKLFKEILSITHLQYNFSEQLEDPLESLRMEYDKLKGEVMLGNDNPSILKQLKVVCVDMYSNKLISASEFKSIITRLL